MLSRVIKAANAPFTKDQIEELNGEQWELEIRLTGNRKRTYSGSNAFPPYWSELKALFRPYMR